MKSIACAVLIAVLSGSAAATPHLSPAQRTTALAEIAKLFQERYVFPKKRAAIIARLQQGQKAGRYDVDDPGTFAERITQDTSETAHDRHAWMRVDPQAYAAALAPPSSDAGSEALQARRTRREHYGLTELKILPGNLRYLKITGFPWVNDIAGAVYDDAIRFLTAGDAVIIDVRGNGGGSQAAVRYLVSHFLAPQTLEMTFLQDPEPPEQSRALDQLPAGRLIGKPLYVLIDGGVASAGEAFAYDVQQFKLGELIGATTAGAANNNALLPVAPYFILSVSVGRPVHAVSQTNWEGVGIRPDVEVAPSQALAMAAARALAKLAQAPGATPEALADYSWARVAVEAQLHPPPPLPAAQLKALTGRYEKNEIVSRVGSLWLIRPGRPEVHLVALTADGLFAVEGHDALRVKLTGKTLETWWVGDPTPRVFSRT